MQLTRGDNASSRAAENMQGKPVSHVVPPLQEGFQTIISAIKVTTREIARHKHVTYEASWEA